MLKSPAIECRFLTSDTAHQCVSYDGAPVRPHATCWYEARAQVQEQCEEQGVPFEPTDEQLEKVATVVGPVLERQGGASRRKAG